MNNEISIILEKLYDRQLNFTQTIKKISSSLLKKVNEDIYKEIMEENKNDN